MKVKVKLLSPVWLLATPWTAAYQAPPSMGFSRQEYWSGLPLPSPREKMLLGLKRIWRINFQKCTPLSNYLRRHFSQRIHSLRWIKFLLTIPQQIPEDLSCSGSFCASCWNWQMHSTKDAEKQVHSLPVWKSGFLLRTALRYRPWCHRPGKKGSLLMTTKLQDSHLNYFRQ